MKMSCPRCGYVVLSNLEELIIKHLPNNVSDLKVVLKYDTIENGAKILLAVLRKLEKANLVRRLGLVSASNGRLSVQFESLVKTHKTSHKAKR